MVLLKMLMKIGPPTMRGSLVMSMATIFVGESDFLWGHAAPCGLAGKIGVHKEHEQWNARDFTQVRAAEMCKTLLLLLVY